MPRHVVATLDEIPAGGKKIVEVAGRSVGVFNVNGELFALRNRCPHQGGPLCSGRLAGFLSSGQPGEYSYSRPGEMLRCPWHGWEFDIRTGQSWFDPRRVRVRRYPVAVASGSELIPEAVPGTTPEEAMGEVDEDGMAKGPYVAETYRVEVDRQYVLVDIPDTSPT